MQKTLVQQFKETWLINTLGILFFAAGFIILNINEGRSFRQQTFLNDAHKEVITIDTNGDNRKSPDHEGKLVHLSGQVEVQEALGETNYNILVQAVKLRKIVEVYQWHEDQRTAKYGEDETAPKDYFYYKSWSEDLIDSRNFHSLSHQNPRKKPMDSKISTAEKVYLGGYEISDEAKDMFNTWMEVTSDTRPDDYFIKMHGNAYYHVEDLFDLQIGDVRVRFQFAGLEGDVYTIVGKFEKGKIVPYASKGKRKILLLSKGKLSKDEIFHKEHRALTKELWFARAFAFIIINIAVIATDSLTRIIFFRTNLAFLIVDSTKLSSCMKISVCYTIAICAFRQVLHYVGFL